MSRHAMVFTIFVASVMLSTATAAGEPEYNPDLPFGGAALDIGGAVEIDTPEELLYFGTGSGSWTSRRDEAHNSQYLRLLFAVSNQVTAQFGVQRVAHTHRSQHFWDEGASSYNVENHDFSRWDIEFRVRLYLN